MYTIIGGDGQEYGPVDEATLRQWIQLGQAGPQTMVKLAGGTDWQPLSMLPQFGALVPPTGMAPMAHAGMPLGVPAMSKVPKVLGILNIIFGTLGLICLPLSLMGVGIMGNEREFRALYNESQMTWMTLNIVFNIPLAIMELASGVGLASYREWGRKLSIAFATLGIMLSIVYPVGMIMMESSSGSPDKMIGFVLGSCGGMIYPIILLVFMFQARVKTALR